MNAATSTRAADLYLVLGVVLLCTGTILGVPHGLSKRRKDAKNTELWRVAHLSTCVGGSSLIGLSMALDRLFDADAVFALAPFSAAAYLFCAACTLSGWLNKGWDDDREQPGVRLIYYLQILASTLSVIAVGAFFFILVVKVLR